VTVRDSTPQVTLVDSKGAPIGADDEGDAATWPAWTDNFFWECEPDVMAELEAAEVERLTARHDAPDPWLTLLTSEASGMPPAGMSAAEAEAAIADATARREQVFESWIEANLRQPDLDPWPTEEEIAEFEADLLAANDRPMTAEETEAFARWQDQAEATRAFYRNHPEGFHGWLASQGGATEERDVFGNWYNR
jgi:hypothetical protein